MASFEYGTYVFTKDQGYFGKPQVCPNCGKTYKRSLIRSKTWAQFDYIPLFPMKTRYYFSCPVCGAGEVLTKKEGKAVMQLPKDPTPQNLRIYAKHFSSKRDKGFLKTDMAYEVWVEDTVSGEKFRISSLGDTSKDTIKKIKKARGLKKIEIREENDFALTDE